MDVSPRGPRLAPLVLATMASQALLVVLSPTIVAIGDDLGASVASVGQARSIAAAVAVSPSLVVFLTAHVLVGLAFACLLSAGFAGAAGFSPERRPWAIGYVG